MTTVTPKLFSGHDVTITARLPDKRYMKGAKRLFQESAYLAHKAAESTDIKKALKLNSKALELRGQQQTNIDKRFERWIKQPIIGERTKTAFDDSCRALHSRGEAMLNYNKLNEKNKEKDKLVNIIDPNKMLMEKTTFNSIFANDISKSLKNLMNKQILATNMMRNNSEYFNTQTAHRLDSLTNKDFDEINGKTGKLRLMNTIKKIKAKYCDFKEQAQKKKIEQEKKDIEHFIGKIEIENSRQKKFLSNVSARTIRTTYKY